MPFIVHRHQKNEYFKVRGYLLAAKCKPAIPECQGFQLEIDDALGAKTSEKFIIVKLCKTCGFFNTIALELKQSNCIKVFFILLYSYYCIMFIVLWQFNGDKRACLCQGCVSKVIV